ncbi:MAG: polyprenol monophosphomannose synthase [Bacteroidales bacterium]|nr:polyprenol monophosphomannose synthase [Bacteroidales bacterium]
MEKPLVIIPTYNEIENIDEVIQKVGSLAVTFDILFIDDNSPDGTAEVIREAQKTKPGIYLLEREGKMGLGTAYIAGFKWALERDYQYIFEMDADLSHNPKDLIRLYKALKDDGADMAIGSRYVSGVNVINWPLGRVLLSYLASVYVRIITGMKTMDTTAGFKGYRQIVLKTLNLDKIKLKGYGFQIEMKFHAYKYGFKIVEIPIIFTNRVKGASKMSGGIFHEALWGIVSLKWRSLFLSYKRDQ